MAGPESGSDKPISDAAKASAAKGSQASSYVGSPAVGTSKAAAAAGLGSVGPQPSEVNEHRRRLVWCGVAGFLTADEKKNHRSYRAALVACDPMMRSLGAEFS